MPALPKEMITEHFSWGEFHCRDAQRTNIPDEYKPSVVRLCRNLEVLREALGGKEIIVHSGYSTPEHNATIAPRVPDSQHTLGTAVDFHIEDLTMGEIRREIEKLISLGKMQEGGLGQYLTHVHYDVRTDKNGNPDRARW